LTLQVGDEDNASIEIEELLHISKKVLLLAQKRCKQGRLDKAIEKYRALLLDWKSE